MPHRPCHTLPPATTPDAAAALAGPTPDPLTAGVRPHLKPGQKGTKPFLARYRARLVCVRDGYDARLNRRFKTVQLIVAERDWPPPRPRPAPDHLVHLRVAFGELTLREHVKHAGGTRDPARRLWQLRHDRVQPLGLTDRIVPEEASTGRRELSGSRHLPPDAPSAST